MTTSIGKMMKECATTLHQVTDYIYIYIFTAIERFCVCVCVSIGKMMEECATTLHKVTVSERSYIYIYIYT